jgi:type II secretory pathway pseudopilin PulG
MVNVRSKASAGYVYLALLFAAVLMGSAMSGAAALWSAEQKRERERELLHIGHKFREAIGRYYNRSPGIKQYPPNLEALLSDGRFPVPQRYLREIYIDPFTNDRNWGVIEAPNGGIMGVHSLSAQFSRKTENFKLRDSDFQGKRLHGEWVFVYLPETQ